MTVLQRSRRRLMLISNSRSQGGGYLVHCASALTRFLGPIRSIVFIPYALSDWDRYTKIAREGFAKMGIAVEGIHESGEPHADVIRRAEAIFVGGGNTFVLLKTLKEQGLIDVIRERVNNGMPYLGASAGSNVACPGIWTTNDMPVVWPKSLNALGLVRFQVNPHHVEPDVSRLLGDEYTREEKIAQFHEFHDMPVVGLREGAWIIVENGRARLEGKFRTRVLTLAGTRVFYKDRRPRNWRGLLPIAA